MKVVWTDEALHDLKEIAEYLSLHYPAIAPSVGLRIQAVVGRIGRWPQSARRSTKRPNVRVVPLGRYPHKIFYRVMGDSVEILHVHHAARRPWDEQA